LTLSTFGCPKYNKLQSDRSKTRTASKAKLD